MSKSVLAGFVGGAAKYGLDQMNRAQEEEREIRKLKLLEQIRKDTEKEMLAFREELNRRKVNPQLTTDDYTTGKRVMRNDYGDAIGETELPASALEEYARKKEDHELDRTYKNKQIENFDADNRRADEQLAISRGHLGLARENSRRGLDSKEDDGILVAEATRTFDQLKKLGAPDNEIMLAQAKWYEGVNMKKWNKDQQRAFLATLQSNLARKAQTLAETIPLDKK